MRTMRMLPIVMLALLGAGCSAGSAPAPDAPPADTMTMAEMRLDAAGGPSKAAKPAGLVNPVANPADAPPLSPSALTDAGPNTPLGKQWAFTSLVGYDSPIPQYPSLPGMLMSRGNGRLIGNTSCNTMTADFSISIASGTLSFRNIVTGQAMCPSANADTEDAVVDAMMKTDAFRLDGKKLSLLSKGNVIAELVTP